MARVGDAAVARGVAEEGLLLREVLEVLLDADDLGRALRVFELVGGGLRGASRSLASVRMASKSKRNHNHDLV